VLRIALLALFHAAFFGVFLLVVPASGQVSPPPSTLSEIVLPGGLRKAAAAAGDRGTPDRAQFLSDFIRRTYDTPLGLKGDVREPVLVALVSALKSAGGTTETIPLPLTTSMWTDVVFKKQATAETLVAAIVQSRNAALLYNGLLSLDEDSRAWIAGQPSLISEIVTRRAASFLTAAPALHVSKAGVQVPGGSAAAPVWAALAGHPAADPNDFIRSLIASAEGRLAYFYGTMGQLSPAQIRFALSLDSNEVERRIDAGRRLYGVFERLWVGRALEQRVFVRPPYDPGLLLSELDPNGDGQIAMPGTRGLWTALFNETPAKNTRPETPAVTWDQAPDFAWLCEQVFKGDATEHRRHFMMVLFAARHAAAITRESARDAAEAIRGVSAYPALSATLERIGISDISVYAAAMRRAAGLTAIEDETRAHRALAQYQGALAMVSRAAVKGSIATDVASSLIASLSAIPVSERGDYEGRVAAWLSAWLMPNGAAARKTATGPAADGSVEELYEAASGPIEEHALRVLTGPPPLAPRLLDWEGTRYRVDFARADAIRITRAQGASRPFLSSASLVLRIADVLGGAGLTREIVQQQAQAFARISRPEASESGEETAADAPGEYREVATSLQRAARLDDLSGAAKMAPALRIVADDLLARGLIEWAYAAALGPRDGISITAAEATSHHDFGPHSAATRAAAWQLPSEGADINQRWRVRGALLGLDVTLANFSLRRVSLKPPPRPSLGEIDRRVFIETLALTDPTSLTDSDRDLIATAIRNGRTRMSAIRSSDDVRAIAALIDLSPQRQTLLAWTIAHDPTRVAMFLSPRELFWVGIGDGRVASLDAWGVPAGSRIGCLCLRVLTRRSPDIVSGRWNTGMTASVFPDLNFRIAELLSELHMPAALLAPVLTAATLDFVNASVSRDQDDRRGLVEFVQALQADRVEDYLALLTTDGPLVPMGDSPTGKDNNTWQIPSGARR
jgi:hypothetical protein